MAAVILPQNLQVENYELKSTVTAYLMNWRKKKLTMELRSLSKHTTNVLIRMATMLKSSTRLKIVILFVLFKKEYRYIFQTGLVISII